MERAIRLEVTGDCHGCGVCVGECPRGAILMVGPDDAPRAQIDQDRCNLCRACVDICPVEAILEPYPPVWRQEQC